MSSVNVVYDLRVLPSTFDFPYFLAIADARRRLESSADTITLWIVTGESRRPHEWDWNKNLSPNEASKVAQSRLNRVILPAASLFESITVINVIGETAVQDLNFPVFHPMKYDFRFPVLGMYHKGWHCLDYASKIDLRTLKNTELNMRDARRYLSLSLGPGTPAIITTRNNVYSDDQTRNSRHGLLRSIVPALRDMGFAVGIIPDTSLSGEDEAMFPESLLVSAAFDLHLRSAIYECAAICLFEPTGPLVLAQLNRKVNFVAYGIAWSSKFSAEYLTQRGYKRDVNFIAPDCAYQRYLWDDLDLDFLREWVKTLGDFRHDFRT